MPMELQAEALVKKFGNVTALGGVSFKLSGAGCYGYIGPNGVGKTTTMKLFTSLLRPTRGRATINGIDVSSRPSLALKRVGSLVEEPEPYSFMKVGGFLEFAARIRGRQSDSSEIKRISERLDLPALDSSCAKLSKGQKRRVFLAALLVQGSETFLLDEPTAGLDPAESVKFRNVILEMKKESLILLSSHLLFEVTQVCDSVMFLNKGKIIDKGSVQELTRRYSSKALRVEFNQQVDPKFFEKKLTEKLITNFEPEGEKGYLLKFDGTEQTRKLLVDSLYHLGVRNISDAQLGLEQAYLELMK
jgi:ABC-type multidrug transport system ATPase subunit